MNTISPFLPVHSGTERRWWDEIQIPIGGRALDVLLVGDGESLVGLYFGPVHPGHDRLGTWTRDRKALAPAADQLSAYAAGEPVAFDLPLRPAGTAFQLDVWTALVGIPYGTTTTYGQIANEIGRPTGSRAVGAAVGANPIGIVIPCHRVIGASGALTGYAGGIDNKIALLQLEGVMAV